MTVVTCPVYGVEKFQRPIVRCSPHPDIATAEQDDLSQAEPNGEVQAFFHDDYDDDFDDEDFDDDFDDDFEDISDEEFDDIGEIDESDFDDIPIPDEEFDPVFGVASGAGHIFGATGGVMEAALRTVAELVTGKPLESPDFKDVRGTAGIKEAEYDLAGTKVRVAVTSGLSNAAKLLDSIKSGEKHYDFIEVMACPGGCVNGGGQPAVPAYVRNNKDVRKIRASALYNADANMPLRKSHENPVVKEIYDTYLEKPGSHKAHDILHTRYVRRKAYK